MKKDIAVVLGWLLAGGASLSILRTLFQLMESSRDISFSGLIQVLVMSAAMILVGVSLIRYGRRKEPGDEW